MHCLRICVANFLVFLLCIACVEGVFQLNSRHPFFGTSWPAKPIRYLPGEEARAKATLAKLDLSYLKSLPDLRNDLERFSSHARERFYDFSKCENCMLSGESDFLVCAKPCALSDTLKDASTGKPAYSVTYTMDGLGRRVVPQTNRKSKKSLILMGCSFTFGEGVADGETYPAILARRLPSHHVFNFGMLGYSPSYWLHVLNKGDHDIRNTGPFGDATLVYTYIDAQIARSFGSMSWAPMVQATEPYFKFSEGMAIESGTLLKDRWLITQLYLVLEKSQTLKYFHIDFPPADDERIELFVQIVDQLRKQAAKTLNAKRFLFVIYPGEGVFERPLVAALERHGIDYLDYASLSPFQILKGGHVIPLSLHPTPLAYRLYSDLLYEDMKRRGYFE